MRFEQYSRKVYELARSAACLERAVSVSGSVWVSSGHSTPPGLARFDGAVLAVTDALTLASLTARAPHLRRADESLAEWTCFLQWAFQSPRPGVPDAFTALALDRQWLRRAAVLDAKLRNDPETPDQAVRKIAEHALIILRTEIEAAAVRALERPGQARLGDLVALMKLMHDMGATARTTGDVYDFAGITAAELKVLVDADEIRARYAVGARHPTG